MFKYRKPTKKDRWIFALILKYSGLKKERGKFVDYSYSPLKHRKLGDYGLERIEINSDQNLIKLDFYNGHRTRPTILIQHSLKNEKDLEEVGMIVKVLNKYISKDYGNSSLGWKVYGYEFRKRVDIKNGNRKHIR